jgi:hypothetical protein
MSRAKPGIPYAEMRSRVQSFDLLLFHGSGCVSGCISCSQRTVMHLPDTSDYTHVGLCIRGSLFPRSSKYWSPTTVYVFESSQGGYFCAPCGGADSVYAYASCRLMVGGDGAASLSTGPTGSFTGTHLRDLDAVVATYDTDRSSWLAWAPLRPESRAIADRVTPEDWLAIFNKYNGTPYNFNVCDLCAALCPWMRRCRDGGTITHRLTGGGASHPSAYGRCCHVCHTLADVTDVCTATLCYCAPAHRRWQFCSEVVESVLIDIGVEAGNTDETAPRNTVPADFLTEQTDRVLHVQRPIRYTLFVPPVLEMQMTAASGPQQEK